MLSVFFGKSNFLVHFYFMPEFFKHENIIAITDLIRP